MIIRELTRQESLAVLDRVHLGRLACVKANQPFLVPIFFAYHDNCLYFASTIGRKIEWMRDNPLVAVEVDDIENPQYWESVVILGRYEEISQEPEMRGMRELAWSLLQRRDLWWEPAYVETLLGGAERPMVPLYFRVRVERITGHRGTHE